MKTTALAARHYDSLLFVGGTVVNQAACAADQSTDQCSFAAACQCTDGGATGSASADYRRGVLKRTPANNHAPADDAAARAHVCDLLYR